MLYYLGFIKFFIFQIKEINFKINEGELVGLIGDNGASKTTTIKLIFDEHKPNSGKILFNGKDLKNREVSNLKSFFPDQNNFPKYLNILEFAIYSVNLKEIAKVFNTNIFYIKDSSFDNEDSICFAEIKDEIIFKSNGELTTSDFDLYLKNEKIENVIANNKSVYSIDLLVIPSKESKYSGYKKLSVIFEQLPDNQNPNDNQKKSRKWFWKLDQKNDSELILQNWKPGLESFTTKPYFSPAIAVLLWLLSSVAFICLSYPIFVKRLII